MPSIPKPTHSQFRDLTGQQFGRLIVSEYAGKRGHSHYWLCHCACGNVRDVSATNLTAKAETPTRSCGCIHREVTSATHRRHGLRSTSEWTIHRSMLARCYNPKAISFHNYGGRGITVCDRWRFGQDGLTAIECFVADIGRRPSKAYSIDRINNDGGYEPGNVRWATRKQQALNSRRWNHAQ